MGLNPFVDSKGNVKMNSAAETSTHSKEALEDPGISGDPNIISFGSSGNDMVFELPSIEKIRILRKRDEQDSYDYNSISGRAGLSVKRNSTLFQLTNNNIYISRELVDKKLPKRKPDEGWVDTKQKAQQIALGMIAGELKHQYENGSLELTISPNRPSRTPSYCTKGYKFIAIPPSIA